jgi:hypothetical protein
MPTPEVSGEGDREDTSPWDDFMEFAMGKLVPDWPPFI